MTFKHNLIYTALFAVLGTSPLYAEEILSDSETESSQDTQLDQINVNTQSLLKQNGYQVSGVSAVAKADVPIIDTPMTVNVVSTQLLNDRKPNDLIDALASVSGVSQANTLGGIFDAIQKRGFGGNRDNSIMRNGMQAGPSHNFSATTETIEVLKGPESVLYGIQDPGGIINVITKKPQQEQKTVVGGTVGNHNMWGVQLDSTGGLGNGFAYRFIYDKQDKDYWRNFGKINTTTYAPSLSWENDRTKILVAYEHLDYTQPFDRGTQIDVYNGGNVVDIPAERRLDEPNNQTTGKTDNIQVKIEHKLNDQWKLNTAYGYARDKYFYRQTRVVAVNTSYTDNLAYSSTRSVAPRTALRRMEKQAADQRIHTGSINLVGEFAIGNVANRFTVGADASRNYRLTGPVYNNGGWSSINIDNPVYTNPDLTSLPVAANNWQINNIKTLGVYVQDTAYLTEQLIVTGGLRYEYFDQVAGRHANGASFSPNTDQHGGKLLYQFGAVYKLVPSWSVYANYAESFRPQYSIANRVDSDLKPEEGKSVEIGTKFENAYLNATLALFNIDKKNVAETDSNNEVYIAGKQRSRGLEIDVNGYVTEKLSASATYTYTKVKNLKNDSYPASIGKQLNGVPKHQAALFLGYDLGQFLNGSWRIGGGARYLGSWTAYSSDYTAAFKIPSAVIYDAFLAYETQIGGKKVSLQLNGKNLTDKVYYQSTAGNADSFIVPIALGYGREVLLNAKVEF